MSGFDKEAERERLREKYEQDQEKRAATQRMSELLLKGATMTNSHCDTCGDPIFRHDGQAFCPTCQADGDAAEASTSGASESDDTAEADAQAGTASAPTAAATSTPASTDGSATDESAPPEADRSTAPADRATDADAARRAPSSVDAEGPSVSTTDTSVRDPVGGSADVPSAAGDRTDATPVDTARASLSRTLVRFSRAAEETDDPRRAEELLGAAREAAEALAALDPVR